MVLNHFARLGGEKTPAQLARIFHVSKGAMTNTVQKLDAAGYVHIRPDWDDARRKWVGISPAGQAARDRAVVAMAPVFDDVLAALGSQRLRDALPTLRVDPRRARRGSNKLTRRVRMAIVRGLAGEFRRGPCAAR